MSSLPEPLAKYPLAALFHQQEIMNSWSNMQLFKNCIIIAPNGPLHLARDKHIAEAKYIAQIIFNSIMNKDTIEGYIMKHTNKWN